MKLDLSNNNMELICNDSERNHFYCFSEKIKTASSLIIATPYLASNMDEFLEKFDFSSIKQFTLITTFKPRNPEQYTKPFQIECLFSFFQKNYSSCKMEININNKLHGKVYLSENWGIITSANFTKSGFSVNDEFGNDEFGTIIYETAFLNDLRSRLLDPENFDYRDVSYTQIKKAVEFATLEKILNPLQDVPKIGADILSKVASDSDPKNTNPQYFFKPWGHTESPLLLESKKDFSDLNQKLYFSKKRPKNLRKGDVVIMFGVGSCALVSYYKVLSGINEVSHEERKNDPNKERWPHYVEARNQSPKFGAKWYEYNLDRRDLVKEFHNQFPQIPLTFNGSFELGTLNYGNDKVRLTEEFAKFLIEAIDKAVS